MGGPDTINFTLYGAKQRAILQREQNWWKKEKGDKMKAE